MLWSLLVAAIIVPLTTPPPPTTTTTTTTTTIANMSKLSFRARALDASKPMPVYLAEDLPDLPDYSAINRAVPQMPSGMEKEEECEHHLQRAICAGLIIPTPEVVEMPEKDFYDRVYSIDFKQPRQLIYMQPFAMENDVPDYDMDSEDEHWLQTQSTEHRLLTPLKFEEMMERLEKSSGQTVVTLNEARALLKQDDDLIIAVFDYWLNKRLKTQHPLILTVQTEYRAGNATNNPYLAFRRRTEKMQTRKNRKNDETSYEKMLKLRRDLYRAVTLLEMVKKREKYKRDMVNSNVDVFTKRYQVRDFNGALYTELTTVRTASARPAFTPIFHNHYTSTPTGTASNVAAAASGWHHHHHSHHHPHHHHHHHPQVAHSHVHSKAHSLVGILKDDYVPRKEKRQYKKRKHKSGGSSSRYHLDDGFQPLSSDDEIMAAAGGGVSASLSGDAETTAVEDDGQFTFRRNGHCYYHKPLSTLGNWPWCPPESNDPNSNSNSAACDKRYRYTLTSLATPVKRCVGYARRRLGRGGRVILDRYRTEDDDFWRTLDFTVYEPKTTTTTSTVSTCAVATPIVKMEMGEDSMPLQENVMVANITNDDEQLKTSKNDDDEDANSMVEFLRTLHSDWLHFRPKSPDGTTTTDEAAPSDDSAGDNLLPVDYFVYGANSSFTFELQPLETGGALIDHSLFLSEPLECGGSGGGGGEEITAAITLTPPQPVDMGKDTRQIVSSSIDVTSSCCSNTLNSSSCSSNRSCSSISPPVRPPGPSPPPSGIVNCKSASTTKTKSDGGANSHFVYQTENNSSSGSSNSTVGCSRFTVNDSVATTVATTSTISPVARQQPPPPKNCTLTSRNKYNAGNRCSNSSSSKNSCSNNVATVLDRACAQAQQQQQQHRDDCSSSSSLSATTSTVNSSTNGLLPQISMVDAAPARTKTKLFTYVYNNREGVPVVYSPSAKMTATDVSSAHTRLMLNSHGASVVSPVHNNSSLETNKMEVVVSGGGGSGGVGTPTSGTLSPAVVTTKTSNNNKAKSASIVRKNNIVMEVT